MSSEETEDVPKSCRVKSKFKPIIFTNEAIQDARQQQEQLSEGRENIKRWLGRMVRVTLQNKLTLVGIFSCTDRNQNLVLANCDTFTPNNFDPTSYGTVMVPGDQIISFEVDMPDEQEQPRKSMEMEEEEGTKQAEQQLVEWFKVEQIWKLNKAQAQAKCRQVDPAWIGKMRRETDLSADSPLSSLEGERGRGADFDFFARIVASFGGPSGLSSMEWLLFFCSRAAPGVGAFIYVYGLWDTTTLHCIRLAASAPVACHPSLPPSSPLQHRFFTFCCHIMAHNVILRWHFGIR